MMMTKAELDAWRRFYETDGRKPLLAMWARENAQAAAFGEPLPYPKPYIWWDREDEHASRDCPVCDKTLVYSTAHGRDLAVIANTTCQSCNSLIQWHLRQMRREPENSNPQLIG